MADWERMELSRERAHSLRGYDVDIDNFLLTIVVFLLLLNVVIGFQVQSAMLVKSRVAIRSDRSRGQRDRRRL